MAIKLGELLLQEHIITPEQLDEALKNQALFGIKLGSSLIEMGVISDEQLCHFLSSTLGVPAVTPRAMTSVPPEVLAQVPAELAGKYRVVPIRIEGKKLTLAMADPTDFKASDEVSFVTGFIILPHFAPDVRITSALSKYYQLRGDIRYILAEGDIANRRRTALSAETVTTEEKVVFPMTGENGEPLNVEVPFEFEGFATLPDYEDYQTVEFSAPDHYSAEQLALDFASAKDRDQIGTAFAKYLGQEFTTSALFLIRDNMAVDWRSVVSGKLVEESHQLTIPLNKPSVIRDTFASGQFSMGILAQTPENSRLLTFLQLPPDAPLLVMALVMQTKVVVIVVVAGGLATLDKRLQEVQKLAGKAVMAFEILIIKNKIMQT
ncbi:MAG TPA: general secretion pathway protein GspE [Desulfuromonadales bacterium]|nr:general secretion pathway protein GspE [Desulfuromonadales bacterium]